MCNLNFILFRDESEDMIMDMILDYQREMLELQETGFEVTVDTNDIYIFKPSFTCRYDGKLNKVSLAKIV